MAIRPPRPETTDKKLRTLQSGLKRLNRDQLLELAKQVGALEGKLSLVGPQSDDELHQWVVDNIGINIPRTAVCDNHDPPFKFFADCYFHRTKSALLMANRGGSKTFLVALLHLVNSKFKAQCESCTVGAIEMQAKRCYAHLLRFISTNPDMQQDLSKEPLQSETIWKNGSRVEILPGTIAAVNGPHPNITHCDEVELMDEEVFDEALPYGTPVHTPSGTVPIEDLGVGDEIIGRDGKTHYVTHVYEHGVKPVFRITLSDGRSIDADGDHRWMIANAWQKARGRWTMKRTAEMAAGVLRRAGNSPQWFLPNPEPIIYDPVSLPSDPYLMGVMLGDGSKNHFISHEDDWEIADEIERRLGATLKAEVSHGSPRARRYYVPRRFFSIEMGSAREKRIPEEFLRAGVSDRYALLQGLMDTDGSVTDTVCTFASISEGLVQDIAALVRSLGGRAILSSKAYKTEWSQGRIYVARICTPDNPFFLTRKRDKVKERKRTLMPSIVSIVPAGESPVRCIGTSALDETFIAGDHIVTMNSRNMAMSGRGIPAQDIITSTRKRGVGLMQRLIDEVNDAKAEGHHAPYDMYQWCVFETSECQHNCQKAHPDHPNPCECEKVVKGRWDDGTVRRFSDVCAGRLARSEGWMPLTDVHRVFTLDSREMWESQQECIKPSTEGLVLARFSEERHGVTRYLPDPENGPIFAGVDFGGTNPHAVIWYQLLRYAVDVRTAQGGVKRLKEGAIVAFDEFYKAEIGNGQLADYIIGYEAKWKKRFEKFVVRRRFADPQGKAARLDLMHHQPQVKTSFLVTRDVKEHIKAWVALIDDDSFFVDIGRCKNLVGEMHAWHYPKRKPGMIDDPDIPVNDYDHACAASRYALANILYLENRISRTGVPISTTQRETAQTKGIRPYGREATAVIDQIGPASSDRRYQGSEIAGAGIPWRQSIMP